MSTCRIAHRWMPQNTFGDKSTLVKVKDCCHQATIYYPNQCWAIPFMSLGHNGQIKQCWFKTDILEFLGHRHYYIFHNLQNPCICRWKKENSPMHNAQHMCFIKKILQRSFMYLYSLEFLLNWRPVLAFGYCRCLRLSVCPSVRPCVW